MSFKIKNLKLALLALLFIILFTALGCWQLSRAQEKKILVKTFTQRINSSPLHVTDIERQGDFRFYPISLTGEFDNQHSFLLDNKIYQGKIGYQVYTPFKANGFAQPVLIDRGFIPIGKSRRELPTINAIKGTIAINGMLNLPPAYVSFGKLVDGNGSFPMRVEYIQLKEMSSILNVDFFPYVLNLNPDHPAAFDVKWQVVTMQPEKHTGYAIQWFAFALALLIIFVALSCRVD